MEPGKDVGKGYDGAIDRGLEGVIACTTAISAIQGSTLVYRGYTIEDLAEHATFEEVVYLLWYGRLPARKELTDFEASLHEKMALPHNLIQRFWAQPVR
jgi:citrate synthase